MAFDIVGTPKNATVDGISYDVQADTKIKQNNAEYKGEAQVTSGRTMQKLVKQARTAESVTLATNVEEDDALAKKSGPGNNYPLSYQTIDGSVYRSVGFIIYEGRETDTGTTTIQMVARKDWKLFVGK